MASPASMRRTYAEHRFHRAHASGKLNRRRRKQHFSEDFRSVQKHFAVAAFETRRGLGGNEPPAAEKEARPERRHKYRAALFWFAGARTLQNRIKCHAARGRAEIPEGLGHGGKFMLGQTQLLGKESDQTGVGLMRRQPLHG